MVFRTGGGKDTVGFFGWGARETQELHGKYSDSCRG
jgi:hypothetical protein